MKKSPRSISVALLLIAVALLCGNCGSKQARYYMLSSTSGPGRASSSAGPITVGVDPVDLPDYLRRPEIVTRPGDSAVKFAEFDRWAEPLEETVLRVLAEELSGLLPGANILVFPWSRATQLDYRISVDIKIFGLQPDGKVHLTANWRVLGGKGGTLSSEETSLAAEVAGEGYGAIVSAMDVTLARLSEAIALSLPDRNGNE